MPTGQTDGRTPDRYITLSVRRGHRKDNAKGNEEIAVRILQLINLFIMFRFFLLQIYLFWLNKDMDIVLRRIEASKCIRGQGRVKDVL